MRIIYGLLAAVLLATGCIETNEKFSKLPPGIWRGVLKLDPNTQMVAVEEEVGTALENESDLPFNFEVKYRKDGTDKFDIIIHNGDERIVVEDIRYGLDRATAKDTLTARFPVFDTYIRGLFEENIIEGDWYINYKDGYSIPFKAYHGKNYRFKDMKIAPAADITGNWDVTFEIGTEYEYQAIGSFKQDGNKLTGTFKTETGDYRFLEGNVQGNKLFLSVFDGAHAFLFTGKILEDGSIIGTFKSGKHYTTSWSAKRNDDAKLGDAFALTTATDDKPFEFSFTNTEGKLVSLNDAAYTGKYKLVQIMGTWCPNCKDETQFLLDYIKNNPSDDLALFAIGYERYKDEAKSMAALKRFKDKWNIPYEVLLGGTSPSKAKASATLPQLSGILSYPTLVFLDKENRIKKIHTGFSGPATDEYQDFKKEFDKIIKELRAN